MHLDPIMPCLAGAILTVLVLGLILRSLRQPYVIGYLIAIAGFVFAAVGIQAHIIAGFACQMTIAVISISLLISPLWIMLVKRMLKHKIAAQSHQAENIYREKITG